MLTDTRKSPNARVHGLAYDAVEWTGGLYRERFDTCAEATVPHLQKMFESSEISHVLENFKIAAGEADGEFDGTVFGDGDFYKWMEAAVCTGARTGNRELLDKLEVFIALIGRAQQPDGYISTKQIIGEKNGSASRMGDINDFEVYNFGHLFTSACLYYRITGKDSFLKIARRAAGYLKKLYDEAESKGEVQTAVCPSHYMGLAELYRTTGEKEYLELLKRAVALRDSVKEGMDDNQDRLPLRRHDKIIGHAVRANYLYAGVTDLCLEETDEELTQVLHKVWDSLVNTKLYITGGCGALYNGASPYGNFFNHQLVHQAYGYEYQLPNVTAYNETCASVGGVMWAWRMFCLEKRAGYADILERMLLNVNLAGVSMDGKRFFYENMLRRAKKLPYELVWGQERAEYILSYCCPPNLARLMAQMSEYAYAADADGVYTVLYGASRARVELQNGQAFVIHQETSYPYDGRIVFRFEPAGEAREKELHSFKLHLRIPGWVRKGFVEVRGKAAAEEQPEGHICGEAQEGQEKSVQSEEPGGAGRQEQSEKSGYAETSEYTGPVLEHRDLGREDSGSYLTLRIDRPLEMEVLLELGMEARLTCSHALVEENGNQVAVERGPLVYCMEGADAETDTLDDLAVPSDIAFQTVPMEIAGREVTALEGTFLKRIRRSGENGFDPDALYQDYEPGGFEQMQARMIPYFAWDNRGPGEMRVWLPVQDMWKNS